MADGIAWFDNGLIGFAQKLSVGATEINGAAAEVVDDALKSAADKMRATVQSGGVNSTKKGGPRIKSGSMFDSIDSRLSAGGSRVKGEVGFLNNAPSYTVYQEFGTTRGGESEGGIPAMLAFVTAQQGLRDDLQSRFQQYRKWLPRLF